MKKVFIPESHSGKWSVGFGFAFVGLLAFSLFVTAAMGGIGGGASVVSSFISANLLLSILIVVLNLTLNLAGLLSFIIGIYTIAKYKEWSICKPLAVLYGLALSLFILGESLFSH